MKNHMFKLLFGAGMLVATYACNTPQAMSPELAQRINTDARLDSVCARAERLVARGLNAGDGYEEVWIRDLNTFISLACEVGDKKQIREALVHFFQFQGADGNIADGYVTVRGDMTGYDYRYTAMAPGLAAHKNTVETDQEASLIQSVYKYVMGTGDWTLLDEVVDGRSVRERMGDALRYLLADRYDPQYGLLWGATTADWGDVQPEHPWGVALDDSSHRAIDIYDQAMFLIAIDNYLALTEAPKETAFWKEQSAAFRANVRKHLWDAERGKYIPHIYLEGSPFASDIDEAAIHYHGGTAIAIEAGLNTDAEVLALYQTMERNRIAANANSIGLTIYPTYPEGAFQNAGMGPYSYQNGGDWTWFGARMISQLIHHGYYEQAYHSLDPMIKRVLDNNGFYEWWTPSAEPKGSGSFRGSAGVLWSAIKALRAESAGPDDNKAL